MIELHEKVQKAVKGVAALHTLCNVAVATLEAIANGDVQPGHVAYLTKKQMADRARHCLNAMEAMAEQESTT